MFLEILIFLIISYLVILGLLLMFPFPLQPLAMYLHWAEFPLFVDWSKGGERFGFRADTIKSFTIPTEDGRVLGAWHCIPRRDFCPLPAPAFEAAVQNGHHAKSSKLVVDQEDEVAHGKLESADIVFLYCHGNAGNRATYHRTNFYKMMTSLNKQCHVITFDYRGFANSSKEIPREETLKIDARSVYNWIVQNGVDPSRIIVVGHSLGSGIATELVHSLALQSKESKNVKMCRGLMLLSGYSSIADAAIGYPNIPLLRPFHGSQFLEDWIKTKIKDKLSTHLKLSEIKVPILLIHGSMDRDIQSWQAKANFLQALQGRVKMERSLFGSDGYWPLRRNHKAFNVKEIEGMEITSLPGEEGELWSCIKRSEKPASALWLLLVKNAGHNDLSIHLVVQDTVESWLKQTKSV